ncbi:MAG: hypothetical protein IJJ30_02880 [Erysipelotrichaceae bacterium]|nr:hypothetical protein [Erysipelotrichaceae bacterium]MBR2552057.1 hypothetical protein [Erysipelotrichaceae bacterium]MBR4122573.1 hypothetical protein [Erysipelotrichaceae bacterium]
MELFLLNLIRLPVFFDVAPDPVTTAVTGGGIIAVAAVVLVGVFGIVKYFRKK